MTELALAQPLVGWDFSWLRERTTDESLPWDYEELARQRIKTAKAVLDVDTGGGEVLARLGPFPMVTWATEGYLPNIAVARARLEPLGIQVADVSELDGLLPFVDNTFDRVINRHGGLYADELERVMRPGGTFLTQQVGGENCMDLNRALQEDPSFEYAQETLEDLAAQLTRAGLQIVEARECFPRLTFHDIAGVIFYLNAIQWQIADFTVQKYRDGLLRIHNEILDNGGFSVRQHRVLIQAVKPVI
jgi:SAM-dependent methyltransferase